VERDFHGEPRRNDRRFSTTDPEARLYGKGWAREARLCFIGHALMENRYGLIVGAVTTIASGPAERWVAQALIAPHADTPQPVTLGANKATTAPISSRRCATRRSSRICAEHHRPPLGDRRPHYPSSWPCDLATHPRTRRGSLWLGQDSGPLAQDAASWAAQRSIGNSLWRWPPMTSSACPNCSPRSSNDPPRKSKGVPLLRRLPFDLPPSASATPKPVIAEQDG
jgi:hypothetical protein